MPCPVLGSALEVRNHKTIKYRIGIARETEVVAC